MTRYLARCALAGFGSAVIAVLILARRIRFVDADSVALAHANAERWA